MRSAIDPRPTLSVVLRGLVTRLKRESSRAARMPRNARDWLTSKAMSARDWLTGKATTATTALRGALNNLSQLTVNATKLLGAWRAFDSRNWSIGIVLGLVNVGLFVLISLVASQSIWGSYSFAGLCFVYGGTIVPRTYLNIKEFLSERLRKSTLGLAWLVFLAGTLLNVVVLCKTVANYRGFPFDQYSAEAADLSALAFGIGAIAASFAFSLAGRKGRLTWEQ
jgi:hypothetical protein